MAIPVSDVARFSRACTAISRWPEIIGLALTFLVVPRSDGTRPDILDSVGSGPPALPWLAIFKRPGYDAAARHMFVVDPSRPRELSATLRALRHRAGVADLGDQESGWDY